MRPFVTIITKLGFDYYFRVFSFGSKLNRKFLGKHFFSLLYSILESKPSFISWISILSFVFCTFIKNSAVTFITSRVILRLLYHDIKKWFLRIFASTFLFHLLTLWRCAVSFNWCAKFGVQKLNQWQLVNNPTSYCSHYQYKPLQAIVFFCAIKHVFALRSGQSCWQICKR